MGPRVRRDATAGDQVVVDLVAGAQVVVDQVAGAHALDQVAEVQVVLDQVAGTQVVDNRLCALHLDATYLVDEHTYLVVTPTDSLCRLRQLVTTTPFYSWIRA